MAYEFIHPTHTTFKHHLSLETLFRSLLPVSSKQFFGLSASSDTSLLDVDLDGWELAVANS